MSTAKEPLQADLFRIFCHALDNSNSRPEEGCKTWLYNLLARSSDNAKQGLSTKPEKHEFKKLFRKAMGTFHSDKTSIYGTYTKDPMPNLNGVVVNDAEVNSASDGIVRLINKGIVPDSNMSPAAGMVVNVAKSLLAAVLIRAIFRRLMNHWKESSSQRLDQDEGIATARASAAALLADYTLAGG